MTAYKMSDSKYFTTTKKGLVLVVTSNCTRHFSIGELAELRLDLQSEKKERKKEAIKKIIASMTVGKDVSSLFPDVVNCMQTDSLELKKLVYLYLMNYAKSQPDLAILAVNTFAKVCAHYVYNIFSLYSIVFLCLSLVRIVRTVIHSSVHWLCVPWAAYEWTRSPSICVSLYASASRYGIRPMCFAQYL